MAEAVILDMIINNDVSDSDSSISEIQLSDDSIDEELFEDRQRPKNKNYIEETVNIFSDVEFVEHFRINKILANDIAERFKQSNIFKHQSGGNDKISATDHVYIFLWFAGHQTASFRDVADRFDITISSLFRIIRRLIYFLSNLAPTIIRWPNEFEKQHIERGFRDKGFPGVIGAIDGSHVRIDKPKTDPDSYYNRKKYFSIQLQAVCDDARKIRSLFVGFPGSVHDARVYRRSPLSQDLNEKCGQYFLLGDSAYPCSRHLVVPFKDNGNLSPRQRLFNQKLAKSRCIIENCFGILKQKFRQLYHCKFRKIPDVVNFIRACCVLHNLAIDDHYVYEQPEEELHEHNPVDNEDEYFDRDAPEGVAFRNYLLTTLNL